MLLLCTMRDTEAEPNGFVADLFARLHRTARFQQIPVGGFVADEVAAMIEAGVGRQLEMGERVAVDAIADTSGGNALFVTEMVRSLTETGAIATVGDRLELAVDPSAIEIRRRFVLSSINACGASELMRSLYSRPLPSRALASIPTSLSPCSALTTGTSTMPGPALWGPA